MNFGFILKLNAKDGAKPINSRIVEEIRPLNRAICNTQKGLTLIEIMISLLIGAFLLGGLMQLFVNTRKTHVVQEELARMQENGRFAMEFLARDIRMVDYRLCPTNPPMTDAITGNRDGILGTNGAVNANRALDAPDTITIRWSEVSCDGATGAAQNRAYQISGSNLQLAVQDLVEGVENMQILYGIDSDITVAVPAGDGAANYYAEANVIPAADWPKVVIVRVSLLIQSLEDNITSQPLTYAYNGQEFTPADRRLRRVFTSTFALRNRIR